MTAVIKAEDEADRIVIEEWLVSNPDVIQVRLTKYAISVHLEVISKKARSSAQKRTSDLAVDLDRTAAVARR